MKTEKEIKERIKDLNNMLEKDNKNKKIYNIWLDAMYWVLEEINPKDEVQHENH